MNNVKKINNKKYKEMPIDKIVINGKENTAGIISAEDTKTLQELNVTVYTQRSKTSPQKQITVPQNSKGRNIFEFFKSIFHRKRI